MNVKKLCECWQCSVSDGSDFCYWTHDEPKHYFLHHKHFWSWAQALVCLPAICMPVTDLHIYIAQTRWWDSNSWKPPNHDVFSDVPTHAQSAGSPLLEHWLQNMKNMQNPTPPIPVIHIHIPGGNGQQSPVSVPSSSTLPDVGKLLTCPKIGPDLCIKDFCHLYDLNKEILVQLKGNGYQKTKMFKHGTILQLQEMSFKHGEIASFQDAVKEWVNSGRSDWVY